MEQRQNMSAAVCAWQHECRALLVLEGGGFLMAPGFLRGQMPKETILELGVGV